MHSRLPTRQLGKDGPQVTALGYGAMGLSAFYAPAAPDEERLQFLDHVYNSGIVNWDTSDVYGDSEDLLGKWFAKTGKRNEIFLATKGGAGVDDEGKALVRSNPEYIKGACDRSLKRLGVESVDLYYIHRLDKVTPIEKTVAAMVELKDRGKIKYLGLSECSASTLRRACKVHHIAAVQIEYNPFSLDIEQNGLLAACRELGVAVVCYSPLGRGFLTGQLKSPDDFPEGDIRRFLPRFSPENFPRNLKIVDALQDIASTKNVSVSALSLAWLLAQGDDIIPIPGTTKAKNLDTNIQALSITLTPEENKRIRDVVEAAGVSGGRYHAAWDDSFADTPEL
ncbi:hypothetical protein SS1G_10900 [Paecilomyces variotii No. 5]|uniref:NADP-dependent oxidoreductase domain-containing protein n=1 Tax=Byssochlamys spectabilis (strain No. 5 / NBRC 109023) TaxID=1356009 RepID=V5G4G9_BYSSN|nr:hypothetical protein SS1G_10900 [Paecilomyces variotii No. 5]